MSTKPDAACEIWIRTAGTRRQAFYRPVVEGSVQAWTKLAVPKADKALRTGALEVHRGTSVPAIAHDPDARTDVSHETPPRPAAPMRESFALQARALNRQIDALNRAARVAA